MQHVLSTYDQESHTLVKLFQDTNDSVLHVQWLHFFYNLWAIPNYYRTIFDLVASVICTCTIASFWRGYVLHLLHVSVAIVGKHAVLCRTPLVTTFVIIRVDNDKLLVFKAVSGVHEENPFTAQL